MKQNVELKIANQNFGRVRIVCINVAIPQHDFSQTLWERPKIRDGGEKRLARVLRRQERLAACLHAPAHFTCELWFIDEKHGFSLCPRQQKRSLRLKPRNAGESRSTQSIVDPHSTGFSFCMKRGERLLTSPLL